MSTHTIKVKCPTCGITYTYTLEVDTSTFVGLMTSFGPGASSDIEPPRQRSFTRVFTCPKGDKQFQATITLTEVPGFKITGVNVTGVAGANASGKN